MPEVHVTFFQHPITVDDDEIQTLRSQGLLVEDEPAEPAPPARVAVPPQSKES